VAKFYLWWFRRRRRRSRSLGDKLQILAGVRPRVLKVIEDIVDEVLRNEGLHV